MHAPKINLVGVRPNGIRAPSIDADLRRLSFKLRMRRTIPAASAAGKVCILYWANLYRYVLFAQTCCTMLRHLLVCAIRIMPLLGGRALFSAQHKTPKCDPSEGFPLFPPFPHAFHPSRGQCGGAGAGMVGLQMVWGDGVGLEASAFAPTADCSIGWVAPESGHSRGQSLGRLAVKGCM